MKNINVVLFDLDGTLLDTAMDLGSALNHLLIEEQQPTLPYEKIRPEAGRGSKGLLKLGFGIDETDQHFSRLTKRFLALYQQYLLDTTQFFPGIEESLRYLEKQHIPWGIVTNKPAKFTNQLAHHLHLTNRAGCIISGDSLAKQKPHPEPILYACKLLQRQPENCLYIGDSEMDIHASKAAGGFSLAAMYGYIPTSVNPQDWKADGYIHHARDIIDFLTSG